MTVHIKKPNFKCSECEAIFIPYKEGIKCPKCNKEVKEDISEYLDFIDEITGSMKIHKIHYGQYSPDAWYVGSMSDHIQSLVFQTFDSMEHDLKNGKEKEYLSNFINKIKWKSEKSDHRYLKNYVKEIAFEVLDIYKREKIKSIHPSIRDRIRMLLRQCLP